jgi:hypothetical protein
MRLKHPEHYHGPVTKQSCDRKKAKKSKKKVVEKMVESGVVYCPCCGINILLVSRALAVAKEVQNGEG